MQVNNHQTLKKGILYVLVSGMLWGMSGVAAQFLFQQKGVSAGWLVAVRLLIPGILLLGWAFIKNGRTVWDVWTRPRNAVALLIYASLGMTGVQLTFFITIQHSNAATATILQYLAPVMIAVVIGIQLRRPPSVGMITAIIMAMLGVFFLVTHGRIDTLSITPQALIWGIASAAASAFYTLFPGKLIQQYGLVSIVGWGMFLGGLALSCFYPPWHFVGVLDLASIAAISYAVLLGGLVAFYIYLVGVQAIGGSKASVLICTEPLAAAFFSVLLLGVPFGMMDGLGTFCIVITVVILAKSKL